VWHDDLTTADVVLTVRAVIDYYNLSKTIIDKNLSVLWPCVVVDWRIEQPFPLGFCETFKAKWAELVFLVEPYQKQQSNDLNETTLDENSWKFNAVSFKMCFLRYCLLHHFIFNR